MSDREKDAEATKDLINSPEALSRAAPSQTVARLQNEIKNKRKTAADEKEEKERSEELKREGVQSVFDDLMNTIGDIGKALDSALDDAQQDRQKAGFQMEDVRNRGITLADGSKVHFSQDATELFMEGADGSLQLVTNKALVKEARSAATEMVRDGRGLPSTSEEYSWSMKGLHRADENVRGMRQYRNDLRDLERRARAGQLTGDELKTEKQKLIDSMPPDVRARYERSTDRLVGHDSLFRSALDLTAAFNNPNQNPGQELQLKNAVAAPSFGPGKS